MSEGRSKAIKARQELDLVGGALDAMQKAAVDRWIASKDCEADYREALYRSVQVIETVRQHLTATMSEEAVADYLEALKG